MVKKIDLSKLNTAETPRKIIADHFKSLTEELPISGGWGYSKSDACIIDMHDPSVDPELPFDGVGLEYVFVEKRIYEEMIIFQPDGKKFSGIQWDLQEQQLIKENDKVFNKFIFGITAFFEEDWKELSAEWEDLQGYGNENFDAEAHEKKRQSKMVGLKREFWFDITSFYGHASTIDVEDSTCRDDKKLESFKELSLSIINDNDLRELTKKGLRKGYLTYDEINKFISDDLESLDQLDDLVVYLEDLGIRLLEKNIVDEEIMGNDTNDENILEKEKKCISSTAKYNVPNEKPSFLIDAVQDLFTSENPGWLKLMILIACIIFVPVTIYELFKDYKEKKNKYEKFYCFNGYKGEKHIVDLWGEYGLDPKEFRWGKKEIFASCLTQWITILYDNNYNITKKEFLQEFEIVQNSQAKATARMRDQGGSVSFVDPLSVVADRILNSLPKYV